MQKLVVDNERIIIIKIKKFKKKKYNPLNLFENNSRTNKHMKINVLDFLGFHSFHENMDIQSVWQENDIKHDII